MSYMRKKNTQPDWKSNSIMALQKLQNNMQNRPNRYNSSQNTQNKIQMEQTECHKNIPNTIRDKQKSSQFAKKDVDQREQLEQQSKYIAQEAEQMGLAQWQL